MIAGLEQYLVKVVSHHYPSMLLSVMAFSRLRGLDARDSLMCDLLLRSFLYLVLIFDLLRRN
jgi:hypothetical protein